MKFMEHFYPNVEETAKKVLANALWNYKARFGMDPGAFAAMTTHERSSLEYK